MQLVRCSLTILAASATAAASAVNGLQVIGFSLRELARAGAITASPQGSTALLTNPAGIGVVAPGTELTLQIARLNEHAEFNAVPGSRARSDRDSAVLPSFGLTSATKDKRVRVGLALGAASGAGVAYSWPALAAAGNSDYRNVRYSAGAAFEASPGLHLGFALSYYNAQLSFSNPGFGANTLPSAFGSTGQTEGWGYHLGVLYRLPEAGVQFGATYISRNNLRATRYSAPEGRYTAKFDFPEQYALGVAWEKNGWSAALDYKLIRYSQTLTNFIIAGPGLPAGGVDLAPNWSDQNVWALSVAYRHAAGWDVAIGYNEGRSPVPDSTISRSFLFPAIQERSYTLGGSYRVSDRADLGLAWVHSPKKTQSDGVMTISGQTDTLVLGGTYRF